LPDPFSYPKFDSDATAFTYLVTPTFKLAPDSMLYARFASGYRAGGPNVTPQIFNGVPPSFKPDKTRNYEVGIKSDAFQKLLSIDASIYYIDWNDIQLSELTPSFTGYTTNAGKAKSEGLELALDVRPTSSLTVTARYAYNKAELTEPLPPGAALAGAVGASGDRLPYSAKNSGSLSLDQAFPMANGFTAFGGLTVSYVGDRQGVFVATPTRQVLPAYTQADLRGGIRKEAWQVNLFANNVADRRGVLNGGIGTLTPTEFAYIQPRTVGLLVSRTF
jgi:outer membrane receptor protein involved in Fe transport